MGEHEWAPCHLKTLDGRIVNVKTCARCGIMSALDRGVRYNLETGETVSLDCNDEVMKKVHEE
jgi:hypothetical protein